MTTWEQIVGYFPKSVRDKLEQLPLGLTDTIQEIRLRAGVPITLSTPLREWWLSHSGNATDVLSDGLIADQYLIESVFDAMCDYSLHTHQNEISRGFITTASGVRVGLCGTCVMHEDRVFSMRKLSGLCIRVPRAHHGCADPCIRHISVGGRIVSTLICGEPSSGKTSLLRDLTRQISDGSADKRYRVSVLDERGELTAGDDLLHCDVLKGSPKSVAIEQAVRCLAPDVVVFDELGTTEEAKSLLFGMHSGVSVLATAHASDWNHLKRREPIMLLLRAGAFDQVLFLKSRNQPGLIAQIVSVGELLKIGSSV